MNYSVTILLRFSLMTTVTFLFLISEHVMIALSAVAFPAETVFKKLNELANKQSRTPDDLPSKLLKNIAVSIALPLSMLFEFSIISFEIPAIWKIGYICPILKKGNPSLVENYRPISMTSVCCKVMESIIVDNLSKYLLSNNLIIQEQFGFLPNRSTCTQLLSVLNFFTFESDRQNRVDAVYIDFAKAFDSVSLRKLILKCSM